MPDVTKILVAAESMEGEDISEALRSDPHLEVVKIINDYNKILNAVLDLKPSAIVIDFEASPLKALDVVRRVMADVPTPMIVLLSPKGKKKKISDIISAGALSVVEKPAYLGWKTYPDAAQELIESVKIYSKIKVIRHVSAHHKKTLQKPQAVECGDARVVAIAASTGGPRALKEVLSKLPADFPAAVLIVQHITQGFTRGLVEWLNQECSLPVREPVDGERVIPGVILIAPEDCHMTVISGPRIKLERSQPVGGHKPSANVLLSSVAKAYGCQAIGVVLTGMGKDGAKGLKAIKEAGGKTITQDEKSSAVYGMPQAAAKSGAADKILPLDKIAEQILTLVRGAVRGQK